MSIKAWTFLVSRNQYLDYRTVAAPYFMCEVNASNLLARVTDGNLTSSGHALMRKVFGSQAGDITLVYKIIHAQAYDVVTESESDGILKDSYGREIYLIEGFVAQGIYDEDEIHVSNEDFQEAHRHLKQIYNDFWLSHEPHPPIISRHSVNLGEIGSALFLEEMEFFRSSPEPRQVENSRTYSVDKVISSPQNYSYTAEPPVRIFDRVSRSKFNFKLVILGGLLLSLLFLALATRAIFSSKTITKCTTTQNKVVTFEPGENIRNKLINLRKEYKGEDIFLSGILTSAADFGLWREDSLDSFEKDRPELSQSPSNFDENSSILRDRSFSNIPNPAFEEQPLRYTIDVSSSNNSGNLTHRIDMRDHPIDLAIEHFRNQKVTKAEPVSAKIIHLKDCNAP